MDDYIKREQALKLIESAGAWGWSNNILYDEMKNLPAADVAPVVHGTPISKIRPQKYEIYEQAGTGENGEVLYHKRIYVDEKNSAEYCPVCNKRLCSRFRSFCPNCGAKMDLEDDE